MSQSSYYPQSSASFVDLTRGTERGFKNRYTNNPLTNSIFSAVPQGSISQPSREWSSRGSSAVPSSLTIGCSNQGQTAGGDHHGSFQSSSTPKSEEGDSNQRFYSGNNYLPYRPSAGTSQTSISGPSASMFRSSNQSTYGGATQSRLQYSPNDINDMNKSAMSSPDPSSFSEDDNDMEPSIVYDLRDDKDPSEVIWTRLLSHQPVYSSKRPLFPPEAPTHIGLVEVPELHCPKSTHGSVPAESQAMSWVDQLDEMAENFDLDEMNEYEETPYAPSDSWAPSPSENANFPYQNSGFNQNSGFITQYVMPWNGPD